MNHWNTSRSDLLWTPLLIGKCYFMCFFPRFKDRWIPDREHISRSDTTCNLGSAPFSTLLAAWRLWLCFHGLFLLKQLQTSSVTRVTKPRIVGWAGHETGNAYIIFMVKSEDKGQFGISECCWGGGIIFSGILVEWSWRVWIGLIWWVLINAVVKFRDVTGGG